MNRLTPEQRFQIVQFYFENNGSVRNTYLVLRPFYRRQNRPSEQLIRLTMERFRTTFTLIDNSHPQRRRTEDPNESIRHRVQELDLYPSTLWKILRKDLGLRAYKIQLGQELKPNDHQARRRFVEWAQNEIAVVPDFHKRILFSDEAHFWLNGYVNTQNCRIWRAVVPTRRRSRRDLTPLDYFLWGYVKSLVYADKPQTLDHLEDNIRRVIADIRPQMLEKVIENWTSRLDYIRASRGSPVPEIIFKM
ncbi:DUF4817 domain-containing protein [Trichonephila clavipes]|nr:DUF4817 domain-containing protein [Trichonephila clavipes]